MTEACWNYYYECAFDMEHSTDQWCGFSMNHLEDTCLENGKMILKETLAEVEMADSIQPSMIQKNNISLS